jgi:hypothetical protein
MNKETPDRFTRMEILTFVIALSTLFAAVSTCIYAKITHDMFADTYRPYLSLNGISPGRDNTARCLNINARLANFSTLVPALHIRGNINSNPWEAYIDGVVQPGTKVPDKPSVLMPHSNDFVLKAYVCDPNFTAVTSGHSTLEIVIDLTYDGMAHDHYRYYAKVRYSAQVNGFLDLEQLVQ